MKFRIDLDTGGEVLFLAGTKAPPGRYRQIDGRREVILEKEDYLPASLDGQVACYLQVPQGRNGAAAARGAERSTPAAFCPARDR